MRSLGYRTKRDTEVPPGTTALTRHTEQTMLVALGLVRIAQHAPFVGVLWGGSPQYSSFAPVVGLYGVSVLWSGVLFTFAFRRNRIGSRWATADVAFATVATLVVGPLCSGEGAVGWANWTVGPVVAAASVAALYLSARWAVVAMMVLTAAYVLGVRSSLASPDGINAALGNSLNLVVFTLVIWLIGANMRRTANAAEAALASEFEARLEREKTRARFDERSRQYRILHDTVLSTLSAIGRGGLDHRQAEVRKRCADDADFLRGLITGMAEDVPTNLGTALADVARRQAGLGLDVRQQFHGLPRSMPPETVEAIVNTTREALNNVAKHSKTTEAWLTATGEPNGSVRVTVTDRGCGFIRSDVAPGVGLEHSIHGRMREAGGEARVNSWPDEGTEVEILWPT